MKKILIAAYAAFLGLGLLTVHAAMADSDQYYPPDAMIQSDNDYFTADELDELVAPIALYPDPLIAQILPAATFADQIVSAAGYVGQYGANPGIDGQPWDVSVKAVAHYPDLLNMMAEDFDWTLSLGQAFVNQPQDVMDAIQRLRAEAEAQGNLVSTPQQQVVDEGGVISIIPVSPDVIYVPQYDPQVVYVEPPTRSYVFITFGSGFRIGPWLNRDCDWNRHRVYYHGWHGGGWIGRSRSHIRTGNSVYVNNRYSVVTVNRRVTQFDTSREREKIHRDAQFHRRPTVRTVPPAGTRQAVPGTSINRQQTRPDATKTYRGHDVRRQQPAAQTVYGGQVRTPPPAGIERPRPSSPANRPQSRPDTGNVYRGQSGRQNTQQFTRPVPPQQRPVPVQRPAPTQRPAQVQHPAPAQHAVQPQHRAPVQHPAASGDKPAQRPDSQQASPRTPAGGGIPWQR